MVTISLFIAHGDTWDLVSLRNVFLVGMGLELLVGLAMLGFRDDCALEPAARTLTSTAAGSAPTAAAPAAAASVGTDASAAADPARATADATAAGERSRYYMISYVLYLCASVLGPVAQHVDSAMQL